MFILSVEGGQACYSIIPHLLLGCEGAMSEKFVSKAVDEKGDGLDV